MRHSAFCVRLGKVGSFISASYHDFGCRRYVPDHMMAYSIPLLCVWLHVACVAHVEQGYVTSGR